MGVRLREFEGGLSVVLAERTSSLLKLAVGYWYQAGGALRRFRGEYVGASYAVSGRPAVLPATGH